MRNWLKQTKDQQDPIKSRIAELEAEFKAKDKKTADQELTIDILKKGQNSRKSFKLDLGVNNESQLALN